MVQAAMASEGAVSYPELMELPLDEIFVVLDAIADAIKRQSA